MSTEQLVKIWLRHCKEAGHTTQAEAIDSGKRPNAAKYATFALSPSGEKIYCTLQGCTWEAADEEAKVQTCPNCGASCNDDVTIADHGECYDCHKARLNGEFLTDES